MSLALASLRAPLFASLTALALALAAAVPACGPDSALDQFGGTTTGTGTTTTTGEGGGSTTTTTTTTTGEGGATTTTTTTTGEGGAPPVPGCGDGEVNTDAEQCDDGNTASGDGCSAQCGYELSDGCPGATLVVRGTPMVFTGNTANAQPDFSGSCGGTTAGDYIFLVEAGVTGTLHATLEGQFSGGNSKLIWIQPQCPGQQWQSLACETGNPAQLDFDVQQGDTFYLGADGQQGAEGQFTLTLVIQ